MSSIAIYILNPITNYLQTLWTSSEAEPQGTTEGGAAPAESKDAAPADSATTGATEPEKAAE